MFKIARVVILDMVRELAQFSLRMVEINGCTWQVREMSIP